MNKNFKLITTSLLVVGALTACNTDKDAAIGQQNQNVPRNTAIGDRDMLENDITNRERDTDRDTARFYNTGTQAGNYTDYGRYNGVNRYVNDEKDYTFRGVNNKERYGTNGMTGVRDYRMNVTGYSDYNMNNMTSPYVRHNMDRASYQKEAKTDHYGNVKYSAINKRIHENRYSRLADAGMGGDDRGDMYNNGQMNTATPYTTSNVTSPYKMDNDYHDVEADGFMGMPTHYTQSNVNNADRFMDRRSTLNQAGGYGMNGMDMARINGSDARMYRADEDRAGMMNVGTIDTDVTDFASTAEKIENRVQRMRDVDRTTAVVYGDEIIVAVKPRNAAVSETLEENVRQAVLPYANGRNIHVAVTKTMYNRVRDMNKAMRTGTITNEMNKDMDALFRSLRSDYNRNMMR